MDRMLKICIPLALVLAGGCATQSKTEDATAPQSSASSSSPTSSASSSAAPASATRGSATRHAAAGKPDGRSVYYDFDKSSLTAEDKKVIEANAQYLRDHPDVKARVEGNADERGSKEYNLALGQRRAESVTKAMQLLGINGQRLEAVSYGEEKPKATGHDEQSWSENRRSDIQY
jgi:peptidoglycan-associated lipoprotein